MLTDKDRLEIMRFLDMKGVSEIPDFPKSESVTSLDPEDTEFVTPGSSYSAADFSKRFESIFKDYACPSDYIRNTINQRLQNANLSKEMPFSEYFNSDDYVEEASIFSFINVVLENPSRDSIPLTNRTSVNARYNDGYRMENELVFTILQLIQLMIEDENLPEDTRNISNLLNKWDPLKGYLSLSTAMIQILKINPNLLRTKFFAHLNLCSLPPNEAIKIFSHDKVQVNENSVMLRAMLVLMCFDSGMKKTNYKDLMKLFEDNGIGKDMKFETSRKRLVNLCKILQLK